jgi:hypothetical protein
VFLAAAMLVHYSAGPYLVFLALHYAVVLFRRRPHRWRELATVAISSGVLLATWIGWSIAVYGAGQTFASNTTVTGTREAQGGNLVKVTANLFDTVVPHPFRSDASMEMFSQASALGRFRDYIFLIDQTNVIFALGIAGGALVLFLLYRFWRRRPDPEQRPARMFWLAFVPFVLVLGVAVHGERDLFGVAHVTLQPLVVIGLTFLAANFPSLSRFARYLVVVGCAVDFAAGMAPHIWLQHFENTREETIFSDPVTQIASNSSQPQRVFSQWTWTNWFSKHQLMLSSRWIEELGRTAAGNSVAEKLKTELQRFQGHDTLYWQGWYSRHGGSVTFLGDHVADLPFGGSAIPMTITAAMFLVWMAALIRESQRPRLAGFTVSLPPPPADGVPGHRSGRRSKRNAARQSRHSVRGAGN